MSAVSLQMARKKPTKKTTSGRRAGSNKSKSIKRAALSPSARLKEGDPTSEAELNALFQAGQADEAPKSAPAEKTSAIDDMSYQPRPKRRLLRWAAILLVVTLVGSYAWLRYRLKKSVMPEEGTVTVQAIGADVEIRRDAYGVPHVKAQNLDDMAFGAGFAMAADRGFQMEFLRRMAYGRLSELAGEETLGVDVYMRSLSLAPLIQKNFQILDPKLQRMLRSYAAGVNAQRKLFPKRQFEEMLSVKAAGIRVEEWKPEDSLALYQLFSFLLATNHIEEVAFLKFASKLGLEKAAWLFPVYDGEPLPFEQANHLKDIDLKKIASGDPLLKSEIQHAYEIWQTLIPSPSLPASNNWVVAAGKTKNGKTLLANDTHLQMTVPAMWYMMNLECPEYRAAGVALPGTPVVALGTNGVIAWGATMVMADNQDIFLEQMREENGATQYLYKGKWENADAVSETIHIRGGKSHTFKRIRTRHGVLLNEAFSHAFPDKHLALNIRSDYGLAYKTTVGSRETTLTGIFEMAAARDMKTARTALDKVTGIYLNVVYADEKNIGWLATGKFPVRKGVNGLFPRIGWTGEDDWDGYYHPSENPSSLNPKEGYVATANHKVWNDESELWVSSSWYGGDRADRAKELVSQGNQLTSEDMGRFQADTLSHTAKRTRDLLFTVGFSGELAQAIEQLPAAENIRAQEALKILQGFDGNLGKDSAAAAVYENFVSAMAILTFADELDGKDSPLWHNFQAVNKRSYNAVQDHLLSRADSPFWDNIQTQEKETKPVIFAAALAESIRLCEKEMGTNRAEWKWGSLHKYYWKHEFTKKTGLLNRYLNRGPIAAGGDLHTLNQAGNLWGDSHDVWLIPAMRFIVDFSADEPAQLIVHMGVSGNPESPHYDDMIPLFTNVKNHPLPLKQANVEKQYTKKFVLKKG